MGADQYSLGPTKVAKEVHSGWKLGGTIGGVLFVLGGGLWRFTPACATREWVNDKITPISSQANAAQAEAFHEKQVNIAQEKALDSLFQHIVLLHAELEATTRSKSSKERARLLGSARWFYGQAYKTHRDNGDPPDKAAENTLKDTWTPDP